VGETLINHESPQCCSRCQGHDHCDTASYREPIIRLSVGSLFFLSALLSHDPWDLWLYMIAYLLLGSPTLRRTVESIKTGSLFNESTLMAIATTGAIAIREYPEAVAVMLFYEIGELLQEVAAGRSRRSIESLMDVRPEFANRLEADGTISIVDPQLIVPEDIIVVRPGERIPLDGMIKDGRSFVDTAALTGESVPRRVESGSTVLSGFVNQTGLLTVEVTAEYNDSTVARILRLVEEAETRKAPTERLVSRFARFYTPAVVTAAALLALIPPVFFQASWPTWGYRALLFLVVSCPCALVISVPLGFFAGLGAAARHGILIKGASFLEALHGIRTVAFDKTGTLTEGVFSVNRLHPQPGTTAEELLRLAASAEHHSLHPIAESLRQAYGKPVTEDISSFSEISGEGVICHVGNDEVAVGNLRLMSRLGIEVADTADDVASTTVHVARNGQYIGRAMISDRLRPDVPTALARLRRLGIRRLAMLTGDHRSVAESLGERLGIDTVKAELLPHEKVAELEQLKAETDGGVMFAGDGLNDAPVLARADIGVAMGGLGAEAALEAADIVLMGDEPSRLAQAIAIARRTRAIVWQNIMGAFAVKGTVLLLGGLGMASLWEAVFADVGVALLAIVNSSRIMVRPFAKETGYEGRLIDPVTDPTPVLHSGPGRLG
jgi:Cd2+/Zn2+-exporting ATPase